MNLEIKDYCMYDHIDELENDHIHVNHLRGRLFVVDGHDHIAYFGFETVEEAVSFANQLI